mgnify:CR=1 FL=1
MGEKQQRLYLASSSPRRQFLIRMLRLPYDIVAPSVEEQIDFHWSPTEIVRELSLSKARAVYDDLSAQQKDGIVIGADTVVVYQGNILGKPRCEQEAFQMLDMLQGNTHAVLSGVACIDVRSGKQLVTHCKTSVTMKPLTEEQMWRYIQTGEPLDKAGAYGIQGLGALIVDKIEGDYFHVVGLPGSTLAEMLREFGVEVI